MRSRKFTQSSRIRRCRAVLGAQHVPHSVVDHQVTLSAREHFHQCQFVVLIGFESQFAPVKAVREDGGVELANLEWLRQVLWKIRANRTHELTVHPLYIVHGDISEC